MGYFSQPTLTVVLNEDADPSAQNSVTVRVWTAEERQRVYSLAMAPIKASTMNGGPPDVVFDMWRLNIETVKVCVVSWNGPDFEGRPVTPANIALLPPDVIDTLSGVCNRLNLGITEDEKKVSASPMSEPS